MSNLSNVVTKNEIAVFLSHYGDCESIKIAKSEETNEGLGLARVVFSKKNGQNPERAAKEAVRLGTGRTLSNVPNVVIEWDPLGTERMRDYVRQRAKGCIGTKWKQHLERRTKEYSESREELFRQRRKSYEEAMRAQAVANREEGEVIDDIVEPAATATSHTDGSGKHERSSYDRSYDRYDDYRRYPDDYRYRESRYYEREAGRSSYSSSRYPLPPPRYRDYEPSRSRHSYRDYRYHSRSRTPPRRDSRGYYDDRHYRRSSRSRDEPNYLHEHECDHDRYYRHRESYRHSTRSSSASYRRDDVERSQRHSSVSSTSSSRHTQIVADGELKKRPDHIVQLAATDRDAHSFITSEESRTSDLDASSSFRQSQSQPASLAERAKKRTFDELSAVVIKDLKSRVIGPALHDRKTRYSKGSIEKPEIKPAAAPILVSTSTTDDFTKTSNGRVVTSNHQLPDNESKSLSQLPRIKKKQYPSHEERGGYGNQLYGRPYGDERSNVSEGAASRTPSVFSDTEEKPTSSSSLLYSKQRPRRLRDYLEEQENQVDIVNVELLQQMNRKQYVQQEHMETQPTTSLSYEDQESDASMENVKPARRNLKRTVVSFDSESSNEEGEIVAAGPSPAPRRQKRKRIIHESDVSEDEQEEYNEREPEDQDKEPLPQLRRIEEAVNAESPMETDSTAMPENDNVEEERIEVEEEDIQKPQIDEQELQAKYEQALLASDESDDEEEFADNEPDDLPDNVKAVYEAPELDPFRQVKDVEDYQFLRLALLEKIHADGFNGKISISNMKVQRVTHYIYLVVRQELESFKNDSCARSRKYTPIPDSEKAEYLPKNKTTFDTPTTSAGGRMTSRTTRVNNRRLLVGMDLQKRTYSDSDILKFNQLKSRKKELRFDKSPIHDWGLFAEERIEANDLVIEYVGEVIRQQVAEEREKKYEKQGIGSSYLFRVDDDTVIDATKKGNIARFINHCCAPNCSAKIITVEKQKKIVIYSNRVIMPGEEITYDYKFPIEADKIPCLCGSKYCKGT